MIKVSKNLSDVPQSLDHTSGTVGCNTYKKRSELINNGSYSDTDSYNSRYKYSDTKDKLKRIYESKCAFCENKVEQFHVEHYRPKSIYYWLAFSWDNLLLACPTCNQFKGEDFRIEGTIATYTKVFLNNYNNYSFNYDIIEKPLLLNPELTISNGTFSFSQSGVITSDDPRGKYTIERCKLDRDYLNDERKKILDDFENEIISALAAYNNTENIKNVITHTITSFKNKSENSKEIFLAFRKKCIEMDYLKDIIKKCLSS